MYDGIDGGLPVRSNIGRLLTTGLRVLIFDILKALKHKS